MAFQTITPLWIEQLDFPPGRLLGRTRCWTEDELKAWVESRPTGKAKLRGRAKALDEAARGEAIPDVGC